MAFNWEGENVVRKVHSATLAAIDETTSACVVDAKQDYYPGHGLVTSTLQGSIQARPAEMRGGSAIGRWGSFDVNYARYVEQGTGRFPGQGQLRKAADNQYPKLSDRINARLR